MGLCWVNLESLQLCIILGLFFLVGNKIGAIGLRSILEHCYPKLK